MTNGPPTIFPPGRRMAGSAFTRDRAGQSCDIFTIHRSGARCGTSARNPPHEARSTVVRDGSPSARQAGFKDEMVLHAVNAQSYGGDPVMRPERLRRAVPAPTTRSRSGVRGCPRWRAAARPRAVRLPPHHHPNGLTRFPHSSQVAPRTFLDLDLRVPVRLRAQVVTERHAKSSSERVPESNRTVISRRDPSRLWARSTAGIREIGWARGPARNTRTASLRAAAH